MLYSTREKISENYVTFLSTAPHDEKNKTQCEKDINRIGGLFVEQTNVGSQFQGDNSEYEKSQDKFNFARKIIEFEAKESGTEDEVAKYFSFLMTNLCHQSFYALRSTIALKNHQSLMSLTAEHDPVLSIKVVDGNALLEVEDNLCLVSQGENNPKYCVAKTIKYRFFSDKTMQASMENYSEEKLQNLNNNVKVSNNCNKNEYEKLAKSIFKDLTSMSNENLQQLLAQNYEENDPFNVLSMNCDQEKCEILTWLVNNKRYKPESIANEDIEKLHVIEKLSKANPDTMARLIHKYIKNNQQNLLEISNDINNKLSDEAQDNIKKITQGLENRLENNGIILALEDLCNIVLNFFLEICKSFEFKLGESAVGTKEFDEFCSKLYSKAPTTTDQQSNFTKRYLETKKKVYPENLR